MAKSPKKQNKSSKIKKSPHDTSAFIFNTPLEEIEKALKRLEDQDLDPLAEPLTKDQLYWWAQWELQLPEAKRRGLTSVPTCSIENAVLGIYSGKK